MSPHPLTPVLPQVQDLVRAGSSAPCTPAVTCPRASPLVWGFRGPPLDLEGTVLPLKSPPVTSHAAHFFYHPSFPEHCPPTNDLLINSRSHKRHGTGHQVYHMVPNQPSATPAPLPFPQHWTLGVLHDTRNLAPSTPALDTRCTTPQGKAPSNRSHSCTTRSLPMPRLSSHAPWPHKRPHCTLSHGPPHGARQSRRDDRGQSCILNVLLPVRFCAAVVDHVLNAQGWHCPNEWRWLDSGF